MSRGLVKAVQKGDVLLDKDDVEWLVISTHAPHGRRGAAVTLLREDQGEAVWIEVQALSSLGLHPKMVEEETQ